VTRLCSALWAPHAWAPHAWALLLILACSPASAKKPPKGYDKRGLYIRSHYTKYEYRIPMRDGKRLFTAVYVPNARSARYPILIKRTPYRVAPYGANRYARRIGPSAELERAGYIFVMQDVRGRFMSEGMFVNMRPHRVQKRRTKRVDESSDAYDTIAWLLRKLEGRHNGRVGLWGISYPGFYAAAGAIDSHPALKAVSPQAPIADWYWDDMHHHGALMLPLAFNFLSRFGVSRPKPTADWPERLNLGTPDGYQFFRRLGPLKNVNKRYFKRRIAFWNALERHPDYDVFWQKRNILPHLERIKSAVLVVGGWYDAEDLYGTLRTYQAIERKNPRADNRLVMGPWYHGGWSRGDGQRLGDAEFGSKTSLRYRKTIELRFFERHLKPRSKAANKPKLKEATVFETGANRWRSFDRWPPRGAKQRTLFFAAGGALSERRPKKASAYDSFISDPHKPVPYTTKVGTSWSGSYMARDQRFAAFRPDVLVYQTAPLKEDLTLAGPIDVHLRVSTSQTAADWVVKLIDVLPGKLVGEGRKHVYPRGEQQLMVRADIFRGRYRKSYQRPRPFTPNKVTNVSFPLLDVLHTFKRGHRIMIHVQSSWFPLADRNPQRYVPNIFFAKPSDFVKAEHRVYRQAAHASHVVFQVL
jgi:putative CocE/NonD family hydrolase